MKTAILGFLLAFTLVPGTIVTTATGTSHAGRWLFPLSPPPRPARSDVPAHADARYRLRGVGVRLAPAGAAAAYGTPANGHHAQGKRSPPPMLPILRCGETRRAAEVSLEQPR